MWSPVFGTCQPHPSRLQTGLCSLGPVPRAEVASYIQFDPHAHSEANLNHSRMDEELCLWNLAASALPSAECCSPGRLGSTAPSGEGLGDCSFWFHLGVSALMGNPSNITDYHVTQRLKKDAPARRHLGSGSLGNLKHAATRPCSVLISQSGPAVRCEK